MVRFIHKNGAKLDFRKPVNGIRHCNEPLGIEVDLLVVAHTHFAEATEVRSELVQQGARGHYDQDLSKREREREQSNGG